MVQQGDGLQPLNIRNGLIRNLDLNGSTSSNTLLTASAESSSSDLDTEPYLELATTYGSGEVAELETCIQEHKEKFLNDRNFGLVKHILSSTYSRNIQSLTQTYLSLSLQDIANSMQLSGPKEAEMHVIQMIQDDEIYATINQKDGLVRFLKHPEQYKSCEMSERIDSSIQRIITLPKLTATDELMSSDPAYLSRVGKERALRL